MSGGRFDYNQYRIMTIAEDIESLVLRNDDASLDEYGCCKGYAYSEGVVAKFREAIPILKRAYVYAQRIDWLVSGDDGENSFLKRLEHDLKQLEQQHEQTT